MKTSKYLRDTTAYLTANSIPSSRLDTLILMEYVLGIDRAKLLSEPNLEISTKHIKLLNSYVAKRAKQIPISYIVNKAEFYGRSFYINSSVMQPRPESEDLIDLLKKIVSSQSDLNKLPTIQIADVGSGSGCLGITAALEVKNASVDLIDIDPKALRVAKQNVVFYAISINTLLADLLPAGETKYQILLCNLPYVPDEHPINLAASHEPKIALFGGQDGLDIYRKLFEKVSVLKNKPLYILSESFPDTHSILTQIALEHSYTLLDTLNYCQVFSLGTA
jgi:release factor glutamine methyltransferase